MTRRFMGLPLLGVIPLFAQTKIDQQQAKFGPTTLPIFIDGEVPGGLINGTNPIFTLANTPNPAASLHLYNNGLRLLLGGDYTLSGNTITFLTLSIPQPAGTSGSADLLQADYRHN